MNSTMADIEVVGTQTYLADEGARETVLVRVPRSVVGIENNYPPPNPYEESLGAEMRRGYFHRSEDVIIQLPRRADDYMSVESRANLEAICLDEGVLVAYYFSEHSEALRVEWDFATDEWALEDTELDGEFEETIQQNRQTIWKNHRDI